jgi:hypothetical protein
MYMFCSVLAASLKFEAFIREILLFQGHLAGFWSINVSFRAKGKREEAAWASFIVNTLRYGQNFSASAQS